MKNAINYFYNIIVDNIHQTEKYYYFNYNNENYVLIVYRDNPELLPNIYNLHIELRNKGIYLHQILLNKENNIATIINGIPYILMKTNFFAGKINFDTVLSFSNIPINYNINYLNKHFMFERNKTTKLKRENIGNLWSIKNDYLEYQLNQLRKKSKILKNSFDYYIGLGETAITLINTTHDNNIKTVCHKRIKYNDTIFDFYNPLNIIIDAKVRDIAEYLKTKFFAGDDITTDLNRFLSDDKLNTNDHLIFLARMIYPTYYFDLFEEIINGKASDEEIKIITDLSSNYEILLKKLYKYYRKTLNIEPIEWLE